MIQNGGFESGTLSGWSSIGDASVQTAAFGTQPKQGDYQALLTTFHSKYGGQQPWEPALPLSGNDPVGSKDIESFLGLPAQFLETLSRYRSGNEQAGVTSGSAIKQQFQAQAGSKLTIHYNFLSDGGWGNANDFSFVSLVSDGGFTSFVIAGVESPDRPSDTVLARETGYSRFELSIPFSGLYTLGIGVMEMRDDWAGSAICVDRVAVVRAPFISFHLRRDGAGVIRHAELKRDLQYVHVERSRDAGNR